MSYLALSLLPSSLFLVSGIGLGMAIVKQSVELQGETITFVSKEGIGTIFNVCIPTNII
ncbi:MAG: hypothetical protein NVSMB70_09610 [Chamaesiphon sp.]